MYCTYNVKLWHVRGTIVAVETTMRPVCIDKLRVTGNDIRGLEL